MLRVGLIDVDTTHPWALANYVNATGRARVVALADQGAVWPRSHVEEFARRLGNDARVYDSPDDLIDHVDAALFCGTRYDVRMKQIKPWLDAGKPVFLDKPAVGTLEDVRSLEGYVKKGARILCGSSLPYCAELGEVWRRVSCGTPAGLVVVGWRSLFEYGLHGTDIGLHLLQSKPRVVLWGIFGPTECVWAELENGQELLVHVGLETGPWQVNCMTAEGAYSANLNIGLFRGCHLDGLASAFVEMALTGRTAVHPQWHLEGIKLLIAAKRSRDEERPVELSELSGSDDGFDGQAYAAAYRNAAQKADPQTYMSPSLEQMIRPRAVASEREGVGGSQVVRVGKRVAKKVLGERGVRVGKQAVKKVLGERGVRVVKAVLSRVS